MGWKKTWEQKQETVDLLGGNDKYMGMAGAWRGVGCGYGKRKDDLGSNQTENFVCFVQEFGLYPKDLPECVLWDGDRKDGVCVVTTIGEVPTEAELRRCTYCKASQTLYIGQHFHLCEMVFPVSQTMQWGISY